MGNTMTKREQREYAQDQRELSASRCFIIAERLAFLATSRTLPRKELTKLFEQELQSMLLKHRTVGVYDFTD
jgi:hypothetical protein